MKVVISLLFIACWVQLHCMAQKNSFLLGIEGNTQGLGMELDMASSRYAKWNLRLSYQYFRYLKENTIVLQKGSELIVDPAIRQQSAVVKVDWHPFKKGRFRISSGLAYHLVQDYKVLARSLTGIKQGDITIAPEDFGVIDASLKWNSLRPYLGIGWGRSFPNHRISFGFDMGVYYMGSPKLDVSYEGFLETTNLDAELKKVETNAKGYSYYPNLSFQVRYRL
jgi:hypothetical protein